jgi:hypothetical protein
MNTHTYTYTHIQTHTRTQLITPEHYVSGLRFLSELSDTELTVFCDVITFYLVHSTNVSGERKIVFNYTQIPL